MSDKTKIIFDATCLSFGSNMACFRSGIYFAATNILKGFLKNEKFDVTLYCKYDVLPKLELALEHDFKGYSLNILSDVPLNSYTRLYNFLLKKRTIAKNDKKKLAKFIWDILVRIVKPVQILQNKLFVKKIEERLKTYSAVFSPSNKIPDIFDNKNLKKYTYLHDTIPTIMAEYHPDGKKKSWYCELTESLNGNDYYFTNSECTKNDFLKYFPMIDPNKIHTALLASSNMFRSCSEEKIIISKEKYNIPLDKKYVFSLCTLEPRKNLVRAVKTFIEFIKQNNIDDIVFVLGGGSWKEFVGVLEKEVSDWDKYEKKIIKIGYVDDEDLAPLYSGAEWFVYTSQYEGFGLPPLEAMSCGCPVITSNNSSIPEVVGDAGIMIDWDSDIQHINAYQTYYFNEKIRNDYAQKGYERSKQFSWDKCSSIISDIILANNNNEDVKVSIVIPVYNNYVLTKNCIESILNAELETPFEIIIADDGSTDETINIENAYPKVRRIKTLENSGFLLNVKNAVKNANGEYVFLMNNDMIAKPKFLDYLYGTITTEQNIGIVGAMMLNDDDTIQEAGATVFDDATTEWNYLNKKKINIHDIYEVDYCSGCGLLISKADWDAIGGFDEQFIPAYYEDVDLALQVKFNLNKRIVCQPKSQIYHLCGKSYSSKASELVNKNREKFLKKWKLKLNKKRNVKNIQHKSFLKNILSVVNSYDHKYKILTALGLKFAFKKNDMKLGVSYTLFDGEELLESSILSIREAVDYINVIYQNTSYYGQKADCNLKEYLQKLKSKGLIDEIYLYDKDFSLDDKIIYEKEKRDIGLNLARKAGCTHFLNMDVDEFYDKDEIIKAKNFIKNNKIDMSAVSIYEYLKSPEFRFVDSYSYTNGYDEYSFYVPFIIKINNKSSYKKSKFFPCLVDPSRKLNNLGRFYLFSKQDVVMHHMSTIRADINKKYNNSNYNNSANNSEYLKNIANLIEDWDFYANQIGTSEYSLFQNKLVIKVDNKFNINL